MTLDGYIQWCPVDSDDPYETKFWDFLARDGITKDMVINAKDRLIHVDQLKPPAAN